MLFLKLEREWICFFSSFFSPVNQLMKRQFRVAVVAGKSCSSSKDSKSYCHRPRQWLVDLKLNKILNVKKA